MVFFETFIKPSCELLTMVKRVLQPQEVEVFYVLPAIRRELALSMKRAGKSQKDIAKLLGVTGAAVSQYVSQKRAAQVKFTLLLVDAIEKASQKITNEVSLMRETQRLLTLARNEKIVCQIHESIGGAPKGCGACYDAKETNVKGPV